MAIPMSAAARLNNFLLLRVHLCRLDTLSPQCYSYAFAVLSALRLKPSDRYMRALLAGAQAQLPNSGLSDISLWMCALASLDYVPTEAFLETAVQTSTQRLQVACKRLVAHNGHASCADGDDESTSSSSNPLAAAAQVRVGSGSALQHILASSLMLESMASLGLRPGQRWLAAFWQCSEAALSEHYPPARIAGALHAASHLGLQPPPSWLHLCIGSLEASSSKGMVTPQTASSTVYAVGCLHPSLHAGSAHPDQPNSSDQGAKAMAAQLLRIGLPALRGMTPQQLTMTAHGLSDFTVPFRDFDATKSNQQYRARVASQSQFADEAAATAVHGGKPSHQGIVLGASKGSTAVPAASPPSSGTQNSDVTAPQCSTDAELVSELHGEFLKAARRCLPACNAAQLASLLASAAAMGMRPTRQWMSAFMDEWSAKVEAFDEELLVTTWRAAGALVQESNDGAGAVEAAGGVAQAGPATGNLAAHIRKGDASILRRTGAKLAGLDLQQSADLLEAFGALQLRPVWLDALLERLKQLLLGSGSKQVQPFVTAAGAKRSAAAELASIEGAAAAAPAAATAGRMALGMYGDDESVAANARSQVAEAMQRLQITQSNRALWQMVSD